MRRALLLLPLLLTWARAGGTEPIARADVLRWVPGVVRASVSAVDPARLESYTAKLQVNVRGAPVQVYLTTGANPDAVALGVDRINTVMAWVPAAVPSPAQQEAVTRVALTYLRVCARVSPAQAAQIQALARQDWQKQVGFQEKWIGPFKLGWADGDGLNIGDKDRAGMTADWPAAQSRCLFSVPTAPVW
ncbi:hypothetical protein [Deinococcus multiflagellatus]|uniref:Uncharacterized protein n=1 Tax=Deinococcus multiflagellatus TaxID=1656887 RepID=A0ABW1ZES6_9DEIO|nr:hypothetical protein [Deinococcus multiflagellatus]MBZ9713015.1 hypothetical protein [Deinococcus multiflagellatus]